MATHDAVTTIHAKRAEERIQMARRCLRRFRGAGARNLNFEDAINHYYQASISLRVCQEWEDAADCLEKAAELMWKLEDRHEALMVLSECADLRERINPFDALDAYKKMITMACEMSRYRDAGRFQRRIAELYEESRGYEDAMEGYKDASHFYKAEMLTQEALDCAKKYALIAADLEDYDTALDSFMDLAKDCLKTNLTKFNARGYFFKAGLILLAQGLTNELSSKLKESCQIDTGFIASREHAFLRAMIDLRNPIDMDRFADDIFDYDNVCPLDSWSLRMLRRYKVFLDEDFRKDQERKESQRKAEEEALALKKANARAFFMTEDGEEGEGEETSTNQAPSQEGGEGDSNQYEGETEEGSGEAGEYQEGEDKTVNKVTADQTATEGGTLQEEEEEEDAYNYHDDDEEENKPKLEVIAEESPDEGTGEQHTETEQRQQKDEAKRKQEG